MSQSSPELTDMGSFASWFTLGISCHQAHPTFMRVSCDANSDGPYAWVASAVTSAPYPQPLFLFIYLFLNKLHTDFNNGCPNLYCYPQCKMVSFLYIPTEAFSLLLWLMDVSAGMRPQRNEEERNGDVQSIVSFMALLQPCWSTVCDVGFITRTECHVASKSFI